MKGPSLVENWRLSKQKDSLPHLLALYTAQIGPRGWKVGATATERGKARQFLIVLSTVKKANSWDEERFRREATPLKRVLKKEPSDL